MEDFNTTIIKALVQQLVGGYCVAELSKKRNIEALWKDFDENPIKGTYNTFKCKYGLNYDIY
jgi:hypothetical protein